MVDIAVRTTQQHNSPLFLTMIPAICVSHKLPRGLKICTKMKKRDIRTVPIQMPRYENERCSSAQKAILQKYADENGFRNTAFFVDDGYSGTNFDRPDWQRLMGLVDEGKIGTIIVKDMSRLGRDYLQVGMYTEMVFPNNDIRFIAINNGVDSVNGTENDMTPFINIFNENLA